VVDVGDDRDVAQVHDEISIRKDERIRLLPQTGRVTPARASDRPVSLIAKVFGPEPTVPDVTRSKTF
jgi:hypothetical protein